MFWLFKSLSVPDRSLDEVVESVPDGPLDEKELILWTVVAVSDEVV